MSTITRHEPKPSSLRISILELIGVFILWPLFLLDEQQEKQEDWERQYGMTPVYWRYSEWAIWALATVGLVAGVLVVVAVGASLLYLWDETVLPIPLGFSLRAGVGALVAYVFCMALALGLRVFLAFERGMEDDTPGDALKYRAVPHTREQYNPDDR